MREKEIIKFDSVAELQSTLKKELDMMQRKSEEYSKLVGEKLRSQQGDSSAEFNEMKAALDGPQDSKKKPTKKKGTSANWKEIDSILVYDGVGLKGELEIYFQGIEELKTKIEKLKKIADSVDKLLAQGLKKELGCFAVLGGDLSFRIAFRSSQPKAKFTFKSIFDVEIEQPIEVKI